MNIRELKIEDIKRLTSFYIEYYNYNEGGHWTVETALTRIWQVLTIQGAYGLVLESKDKLVGFCMGYFKQYDDLKSYILEEIIVGKDNQRKGFGTILLKELEKRVAERGASGIELQSVNDDMHDAFYGKLGYNPVKSLALKVKWF